MMKNPYISEASNGAEFVSREFMHKNLKTTLVSTFKYLNRRFEMVEQDKFEVNFFLKEVSDKYHNLIDILRFCLNSLIITQDEFHFYYDFISDFNIAFCTLDRTSVNAIDFAYDFCDYFK